MKKIQKQIQKQRNNNLEREDNIVLNKILLEGLLANYSISDEVKILLFFTKKYVVSLSDNYRFSADVELSEGYLNKTVSLKQLNQRENSALKHLNNLDEFEKNIQEVTLIFLNANFLDGVEQNQDVGGFLYLLSNVQKDLCNKFYDFLKMM